MLKNPPPKENELLKKNNIEKEKEAKIKKLVKNNNKKAQDEDDKKPELFVPKNVQPEKKNGKPQALNLKAKPQIQDPIIKKDKIETDQKKETLKTTSNQIKQILRESTLKEKVPEPHQDPLLRKDAAKQQDPKEISFGKPFSSEERKEEDNNVNWKETILKELVKPKSKDKITEPLKEEVKKAPPQKKGTNKESGKEQTNKETSKIPLQELVKEIKNDIETKDTKNNNITEPIKPPPKPSNKRKRYDMEEVETIETKLTEEVDLINDFKIGKKKKTNEGQPSNQINSDPPPKQSEDLFDIFDSIDTYAIAKGKIEEDNSMDAESSHEETEQTEKKGISEEKQPKLLEESKMRSEKETEKTKNSPKNQKNSSEKLSEEQNKPNPRNKSAEKNGEVSQTEVLKAKEKIFKNSSEEDGQLSKSAKNNSTNNEKPLNNNIVIKKNDRKDERTSSSAEESLDDLFKIKNKKKTTEEPKKSKETQLKNLLNDRKEAQNTQNFEKKQEKKNNYVVDKKFEIDENECYIQNDEINKKACPFAKLNYGNFNEHIPKNIKKCVFREKRERDKKTDFFQNVFLLIEWERKPELNQNIRDSFHPISVAIENCPILVCEYMLTHRIFKEKINHRSGTKIFSIRSKKN